VWVTAKRRWGLSTIEPELGNIRAATEWLLQRGPEAADLALRITDNMNAIWQLRGMLLEGRGYLERALAPGTGSTFRRMNAHSALGFLNWIMGDDVRAEAVLQQGLVLAELPESHGRTGVMHFFLALVEWRKGPHRIFEMLSHLEAATASFTLYDD